MRRTPVALTMLALLAGCSSSSSQGSAGNDAGDTNVDSGNPKNDGGDTKADGGSKADGGGSTHDGGQTDDGGATTDGGSGTDGGATNDGGNKTDSGTPGWTAMPLPGDHDDDSVTAIFYSSPTSGFIATVPGEDANAGAVFSTTAKTVTAIAFDGDVDTSAGGLLGGLQFWGLVPTAAGGLVAVTDLSDLVSAPTLTGTFTNVQNSTQDLGSGQIAGAYFGSTFTLLAQDQNGFYKAPSAPGPTATYTDIFDPGSSPTVPNPIPDNECQDGVLVNDSFDSSQSAVAFSSDATTIAYTTYSDADGVPEVCVSTDGGQTFLPFEFAGPEMAPSGVILPNPAAPSTIIVYSASSTDTTANYIMRSVNSGATFTAATLPSGLAASEFQLYGAFFLADGLHGWIVGYDNAADTGLALVTTDGGQTWALDTTGLAAATPSAKLHSVFALDTSHVWVGGEAGTLVAYTK
jgi:hypothetical protein